MDAFEGQSKQLATWIRWTAKFMNYLFFGFYSQVSQELSEAILTMVTNAALIINKARQAPPGVVGPGPKSMPTIPPQPSNPVSLICVNLKVKVHVSEKFPIIDDKTNEWFNECAYKELCFLCTIYIDKYCRKIRK